MLIFIGHGPPVILKSLGFNEAGPRGERGWLPLIDAVLERDIDVADVTVSLDRVKTAKEVPATFDARA